MSATITASHGAIDISDGTMETTLKTRQSTPDSVAQNLVSGKNRSKEIIRYRPVWTTYSIARAKFTAPRISQQTTLTETAGYSNRPVR